MARSGKPSHYLIQHSAHTYTLEPIISQKSGFIFFCFSFVYFFPERCKRYGGSVCVPAVSKGSAVFTFASRLQSWRLCEAQYLAPKFWQEFSFLGIYFWLANSLKKTLFKWLSWDVINTACNSSMYSSLDFIYIYKYGNFNISQI